MATGTIKSFAIPAVETVTGDNITSTLAANSYTAVRSASLTAGTWLIVGHGECTDSFTEVLYIALRRGSSSIVNESVVRGTGNNGGGMTTTAILTLTSTTTVYLLMYNGSSTSKTARYYTLTAVKLK